MNRSSKTPRTVEPVVASRDAATGYGTPGLTALVVGARGPGRPREGYLRARARAASNVCPSSSIVTPSASAMATTASKLVRRRPVSSSPTKPRPRLAASATASWLSRSRERNSRTALARARRSVGIGAGIATASSRFSVDTSVQMREFPGCGREKTVHNSGYPACRRGGRLPLVSPPRLATASAGGRDPLGSAARPPVSYQRLRSGRLRAASNRSTSSETGTSRASASITTDSKLTRLLPVSSSPTNPRCRPAARDRSSWLMRSRARSSRTATASARRSRGWGCATPGMLAASKPGAKRRDARISRFRPGIPSIRLLVPRLCP